MSRKEPCCLEETISIPRRLARAYGSKVAALGGHARPRECASGNRPVGGRGRRPARERTRGRIGPLRTAGTRESIRRLASPVEEEPQHRVAIDRAGDPGSEPRIVDPARLRAEPERVDRVPALQALDAQCGPGQTGLMCSLCDTGNNYARYMGAKCIECSGDFGAELTKIVGALALVALLMWTAAAKIV